MDFHFRLFIESWVAIRISVSYDGEFFFIYFSFKITFQKLIELSNSFFLKKVQWLCCWRIRPIKKLCVFLKFLGWVGTNTFLKKKKFQKKI